MPELRRVANFAGKTLLALLATELARYFTTHDVETALAVETCPCGEFGPVVFMPTLTKACLWCLDRPGWSPLFRLWAIGYGPSARRAQGRDWRRGTFILSCMAWRVDTVQAARNESTRGRRFYITDSYYIRGRWIPSSKKAAIAMPYIDQAQGGEPMVCHGIKCSGCHAVMERLEKDAYDGFDPRDIRAVRNLSFRHYYFDGYLKHLRWCREAQRIWLKHPGYTGVQRQLDASPSPA